MTINIKGSKVKKDSGGSVPGAPTNTQKDSNQALPCIHEWEVRTPKISKTVAEKRKALARAAVQARRSGDRDGANSHVFEGKAAKHNTEAKSGNANIKKKQFEALQQICAQMGASLTYKIQRGDGVANATKFLKENGMPASNIIVI